MNGFIYFCFVLFFVSFNKKLFKKRAREAIERFFKLLENVKDSNLVKRYSYLIHKVSMKANLPLKSLQKRRFCKHCKEYLIYGQNCRVRLRGGKKGKNIVYYCFNCKKFSKFGYSKKVTNK